MNKDVNATINPYSKLAKTKIADFDTKWISPYKGQHSSLVAHWLLVLGDFSSNPSQGKIFRIPFRVSIWWFSLTLEFIIWLYKVIDSWINSSWTVLIRLNDLITEQKNKLTKNTLFFAGPNSWWFFYPNQCDSLLFPNQSPVKLDAQDGSLVVTRSFQKLDFKGFELAPSELILVNDGSGLTLKPVYANESQTPSLSGGPLIPEREYFLVSTSIS